jgi:hypothetical protein
MGWIRNAILSRSEMISVPLFDRLTWACDSSDNTDTGDDCDDRDDGDRPVERLARLMGATAEAVRAVARGRRPDRRRPRPVPGGLVVTVDLTGHLDALRIAVGKVEALTAVAGESYDNTIWNNTDPLKIDRMAHLLGATAEAAATAVAPDWLHTFVADQQPAEAVETGRLTLRTSCSRKPHAHRMCCMRRARHTRGSSISADLTQISHAPRWISEIHGMRVSGAQFQCNFPR